MNFFNRVKCFFGLHDYQRQMGTVPFLHIYLKYTCKRCKHSYMTESLSSPFRSYSWEERVYKVPKSVKFK